MMRAMIVDRHVTCGRAGCEQPIGFLDGWERRGLVLGLSLTWYWDPAFRPPTWRLGKRTRTYSVDPAPGGGRLAGDIIIAADTGKPTRRISVPALVQCPRCRALQEVAAPLAR
jgi:hypothetical protein